MSVAAVAGGLGVGAAFGVVAARGRVCTNSAIRKAVFERDRRLLRIVGIAIGVQLIALPLAVKLGVPVNPPHLYLVANVVGGVLFGAGMAIAGGCVTGILWRSGTGSGAALLATAAFAAGELLIRGPLGAVRRALDDLGPPSRRLLLSDAFGAGYTPIAVLIGGVVLVWLVRAAGRSVVLVGAAIGAIGVLAWVVADLAGYGYGLGFVGTAANVADGVRAGDPGVLTMEVYLAIGVVVGAAFGAAFGSGVAPRVPDRRRAIRAIGGGGLMGVAGTLAHGCNIGHGLTGVPLLSVGSLVAASAMVAGVVATWRLVFHARSGRHGDETPYGRALRAGRGPS